MPLPPIAPYPMPGRDQLTPSAAAAGTGAGDIVESLQPGQSDQVMAKHRYNAFPRTDLAARLTALGRDQLIVRGVFAHIGCLFTTVDAFAHDIEPFLVADAVADFSLDDHLFALDYAARRCAVTLTTGELRAHLLPPAGAAARPVRPASRSPAW